MKKNIFSIFAGVVCTVIFDLLIAQVTRSMLTIPVSVFLGGLVAGWIAKTNSWFFGLLVGFSNVLVTLAWFVWLSPREVLALNGYSVSDVIARPIILSIIFGFGGGLVSGIIKNRLDVHQRKLENILLNQIKLKNFKDFLLLFIKLSITTYVLVELFTYLRNLTGTETDVLFVLYIFKGLLFISILFLAYQFLRRLPKKANLIIGIMFVVFFWINGSIFLFFFIDGPYWGRVVDADTGKPIAGAAVAGKWSFECYVFVIGMSEYADARETVTDDNGRFLIPMARQLWFWPFSRIKLDELVVYKSGYDSHPPYVQHGWTDDDREKWRVKLRHLDKYDYSLEWKYKYEFRVKPKMFKSTIIKLNKAPSIKDQRTAVRGIDLSGVSESYKIKNLLNVRRGEIERIYKKEKLSKN